MLSYELSSYSQTWALFSSYGETDAFLHIPIDSLFSFLGLIYIRFPLALLAELPFYTLLSFTVLYLPSQSMQSLGSLRGLGGIDVTITGVVFKGEKDGRRS
jgi:hypothetical protein